MSVEKNKEMVRRFIEALQQRTLDAVDELFAEDFVNHNPMLGCTPDREGLKNSFIQLFEAFPDLQFTINDLIAEGEKVVCYFTMSGTHKGPFLGNQPTGNSFEVSTISITHHEGDRVTERWNVTDTLGMLQQLDLVAMKATK